ncbi:MAG: tRNA 2-thiouridine(34) synthase MnmA [Mycoplasmoidaceae bacterium]
MQNKKIIIGLSGGVDSAVSAFLLKRSGYDVTAVYMQNWDSFLNNEKNHESPLEGCNNRTEYEDAKKVADFLEIELHRVEFIKEYWNNVFEDFIKKYSLGKTPNPDILCNKNIKFEAFRKYVMDNFQCDYFATGHYAKKSINHDGTIDLKICKDAKKDQTYFLCQLNQEQLRNVLFPLENITKEEVREIAKFYKIPSWNKRDSTGICFIGKRNFNDFIDNYIEKKPGYIIDIVTKQMIGKHEGIHHFTIGQRKGLGLSGYAEKYFVCKKDLDKNIIYVSPISNEDQYLFTNQCILDNFNWINKIPLNTNVKIRYRHCGNLYDANFVISNHQVLINIKEKVKAISIGQYVVLYQDGTCLGGGEVVGI